MGNGEAGGEEDHMNGLRKMQAKRTITKVLVILRNKEAPFHNHFSDSSFFYIFQICEETRYNIPNCHNIIYKQMSNQRPFVSRYLRKQNYESMNYPSPQPFSPHRTPYSTLQQDHSANKRTLQQKQIQDLEQKVDIILEHNQKLASENAELKQRITDNQMLGIANIQKEKMSRYQMEDSEYAIRKIKSQLQNKMRENEVLICEIESIRQANRKEADGLKIIIANLNASNDEVKLENIKLMQDVMRIKEEQESDKRLALKELQRKMTEDMARLEKEKAEELIREKQYNAKVVQELSNKFQEERLEWITRKNLLISKLQETHNSEINDLREEMAAQFQHELLKLQEESTQRCKNQREKAENFIRESLAGFDGSNSAENQALRQQIKALQISLDNRKHLIKELTVNELERNSEIQNFEESLLMRRRLKELVQSLLRENQLLKIKTAEKYEYDLREMVKIYNDKIDILSAQIKYLSDQNDRLRKNYQSQVESKIKQRRGWEIQAGSLKNLIRKLKVELHGIQEEFKLNIEGIRDQNMTFSMTLMKSMIQDRDKASFFQDQNRKLRALYDKHQAEVEVEKKQALERVKFYESKYEQLKKTVEREKQDLREKQEMLEKKLEEREKNLKDGIRADREHLEQMISDFQQVKENLDREVEQAKEKLESQTLQLKQAHEDIQILKSKIKQNEEHIQRLRMQLQMAGVDDTQKEEAINHWKEHYQGIILKLQGDKKQLKGIIDNQNTKIEKLVFKYRMLENQLQKANVALEKKGELDRRVIELGLDQGLVKNMTEIWRKAAE